MLDSNGYSDIYLEAPSDLIREVKPYERSGACEAIDRYNRDVLNLMSGTAKVRLIKTLDLTTIESIVLHFMMPHFVINVRVGGLCPDQNDLIKGVIDNGSQINVISRLYADKHAIKLTTTPLGMNAFDPNSERVSFDGAAIVPVWVEGHCFLTSMFVADDRRMNEPLLLGSPFGFHTQINYVYGPDMITLILTTGQIRSMSQLYS
ncbi:uncharacterized protein ColSpa_04533 [Colletotrichum spaethianum]|uniref:Uncharacterized protein n=1 Tax=Colletotrichum spaethianum TaxID=700344 RepID=A0AA37LHT7_9PEZI|nr:uncharacterized protein ColSpa_04533 [Colletotrichum spaethianum]GKT44352.1 hypothetical protein ColSpa_04533 [Colletotrichum spaethianum]